jgi:hypothetical protein
VFSFICLIQISTIRSVPTDILEGLAVIHGIDQDYARRPLIIIIGEVAVAFLAGGIPHLQFDVFAVDHHRLDFEVDAHCGDVALFVPLVAETQQDVCLADARIADDDHFDEVVVARFCGRTLRHFLLCSIWNLFK